MTIRIVAIVFDPEWAAAWPFGSPLAARLSRLLAESGYLVTSIQTEKANTLENLSSFVDQVAVTIALQPTTGPADTISISQTLRSLIVSATGYPAASVAIVSAGQAGPPPTVSFFDRLFGNIGSTLEAITAGTNILTWAIVIGGVVLVYQVARAPGSARKWIA